MNPPFLSLDDFRQKFNSGLHQLLDKKQLSTFILCLANASNDVKLFEQLKQPLFEQYQKLFKDINKSLKAGKEINAVEEDLLVFLKLHALGFDNIKLTQQRLVASWQCQFNQLRSFRPKRISAFQHNGEMSAPFVESQFHFNKPFMAKECFWSGDYNGQALDIFYNKYPFADGHALLVPQREKCFPQLIFESMHHDIWKLVLDFSSVLPGLCVAYNGYGAYASVNHLHFQMFVHSTGLPISHKKWQHNGGDIEYPINVLCADNVDESWRILADLHCKNQPYNLVYIENKIFIIPRKVQGSVDVPEWSSGFTWSELSGAILLFSKDSYNEITDNDVARHLNELSI